MNDSQPTSARPPTVTTVAVAAALLVWLAARAVIVHVPVYDELLHYLAAQGLLATGKPAIAAGLYTRAELFTAMVAQSMSWFGQSLVVARLPALASTMLLAGLLAGWLTRRVGAVAGIAAAISLCLVPTTVELADFIRFYAPHALLITIMFIAAYEASAERTARAWRIALGILALLCMPLAWHLQTTTLIAVLALVAAVGAVLLTRHWNSVADFCLARPAPLLLIACAGLAAAAFAVVRLHLLAPLSEVPLWAAWAANDPLYYAKSFAEALPLLWPLLPLAAIVALRTHRALALFALVALLVTLAVHSIAAAKSMRYLFYAIPWCCVLWACALDGSLQAWRQRGETFTFARGHLLVPLMLVVSAVCLSTEGQRLARLVLGRAKPAEVLSYASEPDWSPLVETLRPLAQSADAIVTSNAMKAIYFLGRYDYELNASIVLETDTKEEFGRDERTGGRAISSAASMARVISGSADTLVVLENRKLDSPVGVPGPALAQIQASCAIIALPANLGLSAWRCMRP